MSVPQAPQSPRGKGGNPFSPRGNGNNPDQSNRRNQNAGPGGPKGVMRSPWLWGIIIVLMVVLLFQMLSGRGPQTIDTKDGMDILTSQASDVKFANIVDNTRTRWGRFRVWQFIGGIVPSALLIVVFTGVFGLVNVNTTWFIAAFIVTFILLDVFYSARDISY